MMQIFKVGCRMWLTNGVISYGLLEVSFFLIHISFLSLDLSSFRCCTWAILCFRETYCCITRGKKYQIFCFYVVKLSSRCKTERLYSQAEPPFLSEEMKIPWIQEGRESWNKRKALEKVSWGEMMKKLRGLFSQLSRRSLPLGPELHKYTLNGSYIERGNEMWTTWVYFQGFKVSLNLVVVYFLSCVWLSVTLQTVALQAPLSMWSPRQEYCSGLPFPSQRSSLPRGQTLVSCIGRQILYLWATREAPTLISKIIFYSSRRNGTST